MKIAFSICQTFADLISPIVKIGQRSKADSNVSAFSRPRRFGQTSQGPKEPMATHRLSPQSVDKVKIGHLFG
jgi:hypothetical protein